VADYVDKKKDSGFHEVLMKRINDIAAIVDNPALNKFPPDHREKMVKMAREIGIVGKALAAAWEEVDSPQICNLIAWYVKQLFMGPSRWDALLMTEEIEDMLEQIEAHAEMKAAKENGNLQ
jgi:hypothetical protein